MYNRDIETFTFLLIILLKKIYLSLTLKILEIRRDTHTPLSVNLGWLLSFPPLLIQ